MLLARCSRHFSWPRIGVASLLLVFLSHFVGLLLPIKSIDRTDYITVHFNPASCPNASAIVAGLDAAIRLWNRSSGPFRLARAKAFAAISIEEFLRGEANQVPLVFCDPEFHRSQSLPNRRTVAVTRLADGGPAHYAAIVLNVENGSSGSITRIDRPTLERTLAHEMGHVLGLAHSKARGTLMSPFVEPTGLELAKY